MEGYASTNKDLQRAQSHDLGAAMQKTRVAHGHKKHLRHQESARVITRISSETRKRGLPLSPDEAAMAYLHFCPAILCSELHDKGAAGSHQDADTAMVHHHFMAVLLLDVSGFTQMTVKLGAEATQIHINEYFGHIIHCVEQHGGDVLKFLGDALLIAWPTDYDAALDEQRCVAHAAASCGIDIMNKWNGYCVDQDGESDLVLKLHGGLSVGNVRTFDVGNADRRQFLIGSSVLAEIGSMEAEAGAGTIVLSQAIAALLPHDVAMNLESGNFQLNLNACLNPPEDPSPKIEQFLCLQFHELERISEQYAQMMQTARQSRSILAAHVPMSCKLGVDHGIMELIGENRWITTLFLAVDACIPHLNEGNVSFVQKVFLTALQAVRSTGGEIRQMVLDDKGCVVICAWGLPKAAHGQQEDACRAFECAGKILDSLAKIHVEIQGGLHPGPHIGIATGRAYAGFIGARGTRCGYAMIGPSVNLAARLMCKAKPWTVLADAAAHDNALERGRGPVFEEVQPVKAKGYSDLIKVYRPQYDNVAESELTIQSDDSLMNRWETLDNRVQLIAKVASVLAENPNDQIGDFTFLTLIHVMRKLNFASSVRLGSAMLQLQVIGLVRRTRGSLREDPHFAFTAHWAHNFVRALVTLEVSTEVHGVFAKYVEEKTSAPDDNTFAVSDSLNLLYHDLDEKVSHHKRLSSMPSQDDSCVP